jgi:trehalose 6-phosphate phosphatase
LPVVLPSLFAPFLAHPSHAAVFTDFDGTLSPIVDDPAEALPLPGAAAVLERLAGRFARAGVVSGRPVAFLVDHLGTGLWLSGLYGLERFVEGRPVEVAEAEEWRPVVAGALARAREALGPVVEDKGLSLTLHFRTHPQRGEEVRAWARAEASAHGLEVRLARASVELHPPVATDKGTEVEELARGMEAACFLGDDLGDVSAFKALDRLAAAGTHVVRVAVASDEAPEELLDRADLVVDGPPGALALLEELAEADSTGP